MTLHAPQLMLSPGKLRLIMDCLLKKEAVYLSALQWRRARIKSEVNRRG